MPCNIYFRNLFQATVGLNVQLTSRDYFTKLPNKNSILRITKKGKNICGDWKQNQLITWVDSVNFYIDVPTNTVVNLKDISNGLTLGSKVPDILLVIASASKRDTIRGADHCKNIVSRFKTFHKTFVAPIYYYDFE